MWTCIYFQNSDQFLFNLKKERLLLKFLSMEKRLKVKISWKDYHVLAFILLQETNRPPCNNISVLYSSLCYSFPNGLQASKASKNSKGGTQLYWNGRPTMWLFSGWEVCSASELPEWWKDQKRDITRCVEVASATSKSIGSSGTFDEEIAKQFKNNFFCSGRNIWDFLLLSTSF